MTNERTVQVLDDDFGPGGWAPATVQVDAFYPDLDGGTWVPVTHDSILTVEGLHASLREGVTTFAVRPRADSPRVADFRVAEFAPLTGLVG